jgi:hypothetical protein
MAAAAAAVEETEEGKWATESFFPAKERELWRATRRPAPTSAPTATRENATKQNTTPKRRERRRRRKRKEGGRGGPGPIILIGQSETGNSHITFITLFSGGSFTSLSKLCKKMLGQNHFVEGGRGGFKGDHRMG